MRVLVVTNMYPSEADPGFAPFVKEQVDAIRRRPDITAIDVMWIDGRRSKLNYLTAFPELWRRLRARGFQGSLRVVGEWTTRRRRRAEMASDRQLQKVPSARTIARLMTTGATI